MPIIDKATVKQILRIEGTDLDTEIDAKIPLVEDDYLRIRNKPWDQDENGDTVYPPGAGLTSALMVGYWLDMEQGKTEVVSESLSRHNVTYKELEDGYPKGITKRIKRYVGFV